MKLKTKPDTHNFIMSAWFVAFYAILNLLCHHLRNAITLKQLKYFPNFMISSAIKNTVITTCNRKLYGSGNRAWARFLSLARSKLRLCAANHRAGYFSNLACDWLSIVWVYSEQDTEIGHRCVRGLDQTCMIFPTMIPKLKFISLPWVVIKRKFK